MFTATESILFAVLVGMVLVWFASVRKLSRQLRERHAEKFEQMGLAYMWPQDLGQWISGYNNAGPVWALLRFLFRREDAALGDASVTSLASFMRALFFTYLVLFLVLGFLIVRQGVELSRHPHAGVPAAQQYRYEALKLHNEKKFAEAVAAYDKALEKSPRDAELVYWRGVAHWQLGSLDLALRDFRRAIELKPSYFEATRDADRLLSRERRWDEILALWDAYIAEVPANADAFFERGGTYYHKGDFAAARADATRACELGKAEACSAAQRLPR